MTPHEFQNALRRMWNLDFHVLVDAGVLNGDDFTAWVRFRDNPADAAIRLNEVRFAKLFTLLFPSTEGTTT